MSNMHGDSKSEIDNITTNTEDLRIEDASNMVVELDSDDNEFEENTVTKPPIGSNLKRIAKKSTTPDTKQTPPPAASTRRQAALAIAKKHNSHDKFLENFDPESSARERRKLTRKVNAVATAQFRKIPGALYDDNGIHIDTGYDMCDCLRKICPGCHFPCPKCSSTKCGPECRCNRKYVYDVIEYHGCDFSVKNPFHK